MVLAHQGIPERLGAKALLGHFAGILITDRHGAYGAHPMAQRQLCWAHVIRNLERLSGRKGDPGALGLWLVRVAGIIIRLEHRWRGSGYKSQQYRRRLLGRPRQFQNGIATRPCSACFGQRTGNACKALLDEECMLWRFLEAPGIDLTIKESTR